MARLQILELPEGTGDDRPPFILVVDQYEPVEATPSRLFRHQDMAEQIGARAVLVFEETIDIPANDTSAYAQSTATALHLDGHEVPGVVDEEDEPEDWHGILQTRRRQLAKMLGINPLTEWDGILEAATQLRQECDTQAAAIRRVRNLDTEPESLDAHQAEPTGYLLGYAVAVRAAKQASREQPTHG
ncbi:hypothetical protein OG402_34075 [Streptomyces anulatus]|uniref:hypothetical protein n=1 Tax=Streptomyces anulatus TaxID=1892 RepID=UPI00224E2D09|nr:hypothetical protein [Streptomyces anulatus]MCX4605498.1 hypothetical protein [Streptomyces anulatus]